MSLSIAPLIIRVMGTAPSVAVISLFSATAQADIPPEPGYVEACTVQKQQKAGETCVECRTNHTETDGCLRKWMAEGYVSRCKTRGSSVWTEVWCKGGADGGTGSTDEGSSCSVGGAVGRGGATSGFNWAASFGLAFGLLIATGRIRRRWLARVR